MFSNAFFKECTDLLVVSKYLVEIVFANKLRAGKLILSGFFSLTKLDISNKLLKVKVSSILDGALLGKNWFFTFKYFNNRVNLTFGSLPNP